MKKFLISISVIIILIATAITIYWYKNQSTIVDLGDGWNSYSHPQIGFTVKIPNGAETSFELQGDKNDHSVVHFSEGLVYSIRASEHSDYGENVEDYNQIYLDRRNYTGEEENKWIVREQSSVSRYKINRKRKFIRKFMVVGKEVLVGFEENELGNIEENVLLKFKITGVSIAGKNKNHSLSFGLRNIFIHQIMVTPDHPHYTQEEIEKFIKQDVEKIKELISSIDNF